MNRTVDQLAASFRKAIYKWSPYRGKYIPTQGVLTNESGRIVTEFCHSFSDSMIQEEINKTFEDLSDEEKSLVHIKDGQIDIGHYQLQDGPLPRARHIYKRFREVEFPIYIARNLSTFFADPKSPQTLDDKINELKNFTTQLWKKSFRPTADRPQDNVPGEGIQTDRFWIRNFLVILTILPNVERIGEAYGVAALYSNEALRINDPTPVLYVILSPYESANGKITPTFYAYKLMKGTGERIFIRSKYDNSLAESVVPFLKPERIRSAFISNLSSIPEVKEPVTTLLGTTLGNGHEVVGRESETRLLSSALKMRSANLSIIIGEPGVGKTFVVEKYAQQNRQQRVVMVSTPDFAICRLTPLEILRRLFEEADEHGRTTLFLREMYPYIEERQFSTPVYHLLRVRAGYQKVPLIIELTEDQRNKLGEKYAELTEYSQDIVIREQPNAEVLTILASSILRIEKQFKVRIETDVPQAALQLSNRWQENTKLPGKAIRLIERAAAETPQTPITAESLERVAHEVYGVKRGVNPLLKGMSTQGIKDALNRRVFSQDNAIEQIARSITRARAGLKPPNKPIGVFLLAGPTGIGKTEIAKALAQLFYGDDEAMLRYDMSEFYAEHLVAKLIGSPTGYRGHESGGDLTNKMMSNPFRVLLLDEFEKAHPKIQDIFLQVFDDARLTDMRGKTASFSDVIIILTTNLGARDAFKKQTETRHLGFGALEEHNQNLDFDAHYQTSITNAINQWFRPEFVARTEMIILEPLTKDTAKLILQKIIDKTNFYLSGRSYTLHATEEAKEFILTCGFSAELGARNLERTWEKLVGFMLSEKLVEHAYLPGTKFFIALDDDKQISLTIEEPHTKDDEEISVGENTDIEPNINS